MNYKDSFSINFHLDIEDLNYDEDNRNMIINSLKHGILSHILS